jgi:hypothetical protein
MKTHREALIDLLEWLIEDQVRQVRQHPENEVAIAEIVARIDAAKDGLAWLHRGAA